MTVKPTGHASKKVLPFDDAPFLKRRPLKKDQVELMALLTRELVEAWRRRPGQFLSGLPEYERFTKCAYACAFVCGDLSVDCSFNGLTYDEVLSSPRALREWPLSLVRHLVHVLVRTERWNLEVIDEEVGMVRRALDQGLITEVANRLKALIEAP